MTAIGIDLTNAVAKFTGNMSGTWLPSVVLPMTDNEPIITGENVKQHRRGSGFKWPPECQIFYGGSEQFGKARVTLAELWRYLSPFEVQDQAWDNYQPYQKQVSWQPDLEKSGSPISFSVEDLISQVITSIFPDIHSEDQVALVVPDDLGEGAQQALLDACRGFPDLHLLPRPVAIACHWCAEQDVALFSVENQDSNTCGFIWILAMGLDRWELSQVEIRKENNSLVPVRDHTVYSSGLAVDSLSMLAAYGIATGKSSLESVWYDLMIGSLTKDLIAESSTACSSIDFNRACKIVSAWPGRLKQTKYDLSLSLDEVKQKLVDRWRGQRPKDFSGFYSHINSNCLAAIADGSLATLEIDGVAMGKILLEGFSDQISVSNGHAVFKGAEGVALQLAQGDTHTPPYYDRIAPISIYYQGRDKYNDPIIDTKPLIKARTVPAGQVARTDEPITEFSIGRDKSSLNLTLARKFGKQIEYREVRADLREKTRQDESVEITAEIRPGQGFAQAHVVSVKRGLFESMLNWRKMETCEKPQTPFYAWPPGVVFVLTNHQNIDQRLEKTIQELSISTRGRQYRQVSFRSANLLADLLAKWSYGENNCYNGVLSNRDSVKTFYTPEKLQLLIDVLGAAIEKHPYSSELLRLSGWMYQACPKETINVVEKRLLNGVLESRDPEVIGKAFQTKKQMRCFAVFLSDQFKVGNKNYNWVRAFRDLIRFRANALSPEVVTSKELNEIESGILSILEEYKNSERSSFYNASLYLAPHLLKRRRFDPDFLKKGSCRWNKWMDHLKFAKRYRNFRQQEFARLMILFLQSNATQSDLLKFQQADAES